MKNDLAIVCATIYGEAARQSAASWATIAHIMNNRVGYREWKANKSMAAVAMNTGFDAYSHKTTLYKKVFEAYTSVSEGREDVRMALLLDTVKPIFEGSVPDNTGRAVMYYSPKAQATLHEKHPSTYAASPRWNFSLLEQAQVAGTQSDDFAWYRYKGAGVDITVLDKDRAPIVGLKYEIKEKGKTIAQGSTKSNGKTVKLKEQFDGDTELSVWVENLKSGFKQVAQLVVKLGEELSVTLTSPKTKHILDLLKHQGSPGSYVHKAQHEVKKGETLSSIASKHSTTAQVLQTLNRIANPNQIEVGQKLKLPNSVHTSAAPAPAGTAPKAERTKQGKPVAIAAPRIKPPNPSLDKLFEILKANVLRGKKDEGLSGPSAVAKSIKGEPISPHVKESYDSISYCYKYVKIALQASGMVNTYLSGIPAKDAGSELEKQGFVNLLDDANHGLTSPHDAPRGAVIVYDVTDNSKYGHIEIYDGEKYFYSDFSTENSRVTTSGYKPLPRSMEGRGRKVSGIWQRKDVK